MADEDSTMDEEHHTSATTTRGSKDNNNNNNKLTISPPSTTIHHNKGFAFVAFVETASAAAARTTLDGTDFQGRLLHILPARKVKNNHDGDQNDLAQNKNLSYKQRQALLRRQQEVAASGNNTTPSGWSTSFVRGDAVIDSLAELLGLRKADIVNAKQDGITAGDAAVRLALGETHVIEENRSYFRTFGVDMDALVLAKTSSEPNTSANQGAPADHEIVRSKKAILVKNLPFSTTSEELTKVFHGAASTADEAPQRILLPPSRTIALVEYANAGNAKRAFRRLSYKRFQHVPLYLEWAPLAVIGGDQPDSVAALATSTNKETETSNLTASSKALSSPDAMDDDDDVRQGVSHTIYVKNLNFTTTESTLQQVFGKHGTVRAVKIPQKIAPIQKNGPTERDSDVKTLSMGYGFVELASPDEVRRAIQQLQGTLVEGHAIELKPSNKEIATRHAKSKLSSSDKTKHRTKLMVRNVAFQASRKELLQLFGSFGQLRKVRLPKKFDGTHRGFAFCEYLTHKEAEAAMQSLSQTHLYGRHLVLEWASEEDANDVESGGGEMTKLREKAQRDVALQDQKLEPKKKRARTV
jgi:multiple RNA-binding domain-containing protein 1